MRLFSRLVARLRSVYLQLPFEGVSSPIFIIGCGRSGTTILGKILSEHPEVTYLNEPHHLWAEVFPNTDIWSANAGIVGGKLFLSEEDIDEKSARVLSRSFQFETFLTHRKRFIEKLPINAFRLGFIHAIFPTAQFVFIHRNGLEVAASIEKICEISPWFGAQDFKWKQLERFCLENTVTRGLPELCHTNYERGLLEWRLSIEATIDFFHQRQDVQVHELSYSALLNEPSQTVGGVLEYLSLDKSKRVLDFATEQLNRKSKKIDVVDTVPILKKIGGKYLEASMDGRNLL